MDRIPRPLFERARQVFAVGTRPLAQRPLAPLLAPAIAAGLLGVSLLSSPVTAAASSGPSSEMPKTVSASNATVPAHFVESGFMAQSSRLSWVLPTGQVDGLELINEWKAGGVSPDQAFEMISLLAWTQSPIIARTQSIADWARTVSKETEDLLAVKTGDQATTVLSRLSREDLVLKGLLHSSEGDNAMPSSDRTWSAVVNYWQIMSSDRLEEITSLPVAADTPQDMEAAKAHLLRAVDSAGLAGLRVPLATFNDSANVDRLATRIEQANAELQRATGWSGPVLGLHDRVMLTIMSPLGMSMAFPQSKGVFGMASTWGDLGHEWFHVVDFSLRTQPGNFDKPGGFTLSVQLESSTPQTPVQRMWRNLPDQLRQASIEGGGRWYLDRDDRVRELLQSDDEDDHWHADYIQRSHETLAFAWQSHMKVNASSGALLVEPGSGRHATDGVMGPRAEEDAVVAPVWRQAMSSLNTLWWSPQLPLSSKMVARRSQNAEPVSRSMLAPGR